MRKKTIHRYIAFCLISSILAAPSFCKSLSEAYTIKYYDGEEDVAIYDGKPQSIIIQAVDENQNQLTPYEEYTNKSNGNKFITPDLPTEAGEYDAKITVTGAQGVYNLPPLVFTIEKKKIYITPDPDKNKRSYTDSHPTGSLYYVDDLQNQLVDQTTHTITGDPTLTAPKADNNSDVGTYQITFSKGTLVANPDNYDFVGLSGSYTIESAPLNIQVAPIPNIQYGDPIPTTFDFDATGLKTGETKAVLTGKPVFELEEKVGFPPGTYKVDVSRGTLGSNNYDIANSGFTPGQLVILKQNQTLKNTPPASITLEFDKTDTSLPLSTDQGLPLTYTSNDPNFVKVVSGNEIKAVGVTPSSSSVLVTASQGGNGFYNSNIFFSVPIVVLPQKIDDIASYPLFEPIQLAPAGLANPIVIEDYLSATPNYYTQNHPNAPSVGPYVKFSVEWSTPGIIPPPSITKGELTVTDFGPVIVKVEIDDSSGNYDADPTYRSIDIVQGSAQSNNGNTNTPVVASPAPLQPPTNQPNPQNPPSTDPDPLDAGKPLDGTGWHYLDWFGYYYMSPSVNQGWIYHYQHGWLWVSDFSSLPIWIYHPGKDVNSNVIGWLYTQDVSREFLYPFFYWENEKTPIWFEEILDDGARTALFYNYNDFDWFEVTP